MLYAAELRQKAIGVIDRPFPAYESIPKAEMRAAYFWELDREFLEDWEDPRRPWPRLRDTERKELLPRLGQPFFDDDMPPVAAYLYPPFLLLKEPHDMGDMEEPKVMGLSKEDWGWFFCSLQECRRNEKVLTDESESSWKHLRDSHGSFRLVFSIDPKRPLKDVMADIEKELKCLHRFPDSKPPPRGDDWPSRLCDLLTLRLETAGHELNEVRALLEPFQRAFGLAELKTKKHWSTRRGRAKRALQERQTELERLRKVECALDRDGPHYWKNERLNMWGSQGFGGSSEIGWQKPHRIKTCGMLAPMIQPPWLHFLSLRGIMPESNDVDWADVWFDFEDWKKANPEIYTKFSHEGLAEYQGHLQASATKGTISANGALLTPIRTKVPQPVTK